MIDTWTVSAPSRLHFGLVDLGGDRGRIDGGAGVAIEQPRVRVRARRVEGDAAPPAEDVAELAYRLADRLRVDLSTVEIEVLERLPSHVGLGSHTQLALAVGTAMTRAAARNADAVNIAEAAGRGGTSGIGVHAFAGGGLVVDGGHSFGPGADKEQCRPSSASKAPVAPLLARYELPPEWRFALVTPRSAKGANGSREVSLFEEAFPLPPDQTGEVCRRVLLGLMPGAARGDVELVGRSLSALQSIGFKRFEVSLQPEPVQGLLDVLVEGGAVGAGLTSFGPTVYALAPDEERAHAALSAATEHLATHGLAADAWVTAPDNRGALLSASSSSEE